MNRRDSSHNWGKAKTPSTMGKRRAAMRIVNDSVHGLVVVYEQEPLASGLGITTLVYDSASAFVRIEAFPANWLSLSDQELLQLAVLQAQ